MQHEVYGIINPSVPFGEKDTTRDRIAQVYDHAEATGGEVVAGHTLLRRGGTEFLYLVVRPPVDPKMVNGSGAAGANGFGTIASEQVQAS